MVSHPFHGPYKFPWEVDEGGALCDTDSCKVAVDVPQAGFVVGDSWLTNSACLHTCLLGYQGWVFQALNCICSWSVTLVTNCCSCCLLALEYVIGSFVIHLYGACRCGLLPCSGHYHSSCAKSVTNVVVHWHDKLCYPVAFCTHHSGDYLVDGCPIYLINLAIVEV